MKKRLIISAPLLLAICCLVSAQTLTTVTATVTDQSGQTWNNGTWAASFIPTPNTPGPFTNNGFPIQGSGLLSGSLNSFGQFTISLDNNTVVLPANSKWSFVLCPNASIQCVSIAPLVISGVSMNLSTVFTNALAGISISASPILSRAYGDTEVNGILGSQYVRVSDNSLRLCLQAVCTGTGWAGFSSVLSLNNAWTGTNTFYNTVNFYPGANTNFGSTTTSTFQDGSTVTSSGFSIVSQHLNLSALAAGGATLGQYLYYNGTNWVPTTVTPATNSQVILSPVANGNALCTWNVNPSTTYNFIANFDYDQGNGSYAWWLLKTGVGTTGLSSLWMHARNYIDNSSDGTDGYCNSLECGGQNGGNGFTNTSLGSCRNGVTECEENLWGSFTTNSTTGTTFVIYFGASSGGSPSAEVVGGNCVLFQE